MSIQTIKREHKQGHETVPLLGSTEGSSHRPLLVQVAYYAEKPRKDEESNKNWAKRVFQPQTDKTAMKNWIKEELKKF